MLYGYLMQFSINLLKILCTNVAWQRRKLGKVLQDWRVIYVQVCDANVYTFMIVHVLKHKEQDFVRCILHLCVEDLKNHVFLPFLVNSSSINDLLERLFL